MAKPRVFISSTYYDLRWIRRSVEQFVESIGYEAIVFEAGAIPFSHDQPPDQSCYREIALCHMFVLVIGGRYGSPTSEDRARVEEQRRNLLKGVEFYNSITKKEYETARERNLPIYIFVERGVLAEYETFKKNRANREIVYAHVDSVQIFTLLDDIFGQKQNNFVREFSNSDDITIWLRDQWAGLMAQFISEGRERASVGQIKGQIDSLTAVVDALKSYSENILQSVNKDDSKDIIEKVEHELRHKTMEAVLQSSRVLSHMIEEHGAPADIIAGILRTASSPQDAAKQIRDRMTDVGCGVFEHTLKVNPEAFYEELRRVRRVLGEKAWPHLEGAEVSKLMKVSPGDPARNGPARGSKGESGKA